MIHTAVRTDFANEIFSRYMHSDLPLMPAKLTFLQQAENEAETITNHYETYLQNVQEITHNTEENLILNLKLDFHFLNKTLSRTLPGVSVPKKLSDKIKKDPLSVLELGQQGKKLSSEVQKLVQKDWPDNTHAQGESTSLRAAERNSAAENGKWFPEAQHVLAEKPAFEHPDLLQTPRPVPQIKLHTTSSKQDAEKNSSEKKPESSTDRQKQTAKKAADPINKKTEHQIKTPVPPENKARAEVRPFPTAEQQSLQEAKDNSASDAQMQFSQAPLVHAEAPRSPETVAQKQDNAQVSPHETKPALKSVPQEKAAQQEEETVKPQSAAVLQQPFPTAESLLEKNSSDKAADSGWFPAAEHVLAAPPVQPEMPGTAIPMRHHSKHHDAASRPEKKQWSFSEQELSQMSLMLKANGYRVQQNPDTVPSAFTVSGRNYAKRELLNTPAQAINLLYNKSETPHSSQKAAAEKTDQKRGVHPAAPAAISEQQELLLKEFAQAASAAEAVHTAPIPARTKIIYRKIEQVPQKDGSSQENLHRTHRLTPSTVSAVQKILLNNKLYNRSSSAISERAVSQLPSEQQPVPQELQHKHAVHFDAAESEIGRVPQIGRMLQQESIPAAMVYLQDAAQQATMAPMTISKIITEQSLRQKSSSIARPAVMMLQHVNKINQGISETDGSGQNAIPTELVGDLTMSAAKALSAAQMPARVTPLSDPVIIYRREPQPEKSEEHADSSEQPADIQTIRRVVKQETKETSKRHVRAINEPASVNAPTQEIVRESINDEQVHILADRVYNLLEKRLRFEKQRRGGF